MNLSNQIAPLLAVAIVIFIRRSYGIQPAYVCVFQIALLQTLCQNLNGLSLQAEISWSVVWSHFVVAPFLQGAGPRKVAFFAAVIHGACRAV